MAALIKLIFLLFKDSIVSFGLLSQVNNVLAKVFMWIQSQCCITYNFV